VKIWIFAEQPMPIAKDVDGNKQVDNQEEDSCCWQSGKPLRFRARANQTTQACDARPV
jgi:hypothetical protein